MRRDGGGGEASLSLKKKDYLKTTYCVSGTGLALLICLYHLTFITLYKVVVVLCYT